MSVTWNVLKYVFLINKNKSFSGRVKGFRSVWGKSKKDHCKHIKKG